VIPVQFVVVVGNRQTGDFVSCPVTPDPEQALQLLGALEVYNPNGIASLHVYDPSIPGGVFPGIVLRIAEGRWTFYGASACRPPLAGPAA
jgi:hypothetical protein